MKKSGTGRTEVRKKKTVSKKPIGIKELERRINAAYSLFATIWGPEKVVLRASKFGAVELMQSNKLEDRVLALHRIVTQDIGTDKAPPIDEIPGMLDDMIEDLSEQLARRAVEEQLDKKISQRMEDRHQEYVREIRSMVIKEELQEETPGAVKKLADLEAKESKKLTRSVNEMLRPLTIDEIIGQERAAEILRSKLASPYPQHLILYGPPGVGKTTAARLVLEEAKRLGYTPFIEDAPFVEVDGTTLRWDPRDITNPLIGSVHDPIYQGARRDLAETGVPEPKPGLVTDAHGGILFIDEIGEMDPMLLNKLLKVLEDKRVRFESAYYDGNEPNIPRYVRKLFEEGAPADFVLIGATTRDPGQLNPALRSRCAEVFFEPLTPKQIEVIVENAARRLKVNLGKNVAATISEYTVEGRKAVNILADAYSLALYRRGNGEKTVRIVRHEDVLRVLQVGRMTPYVNRRASAEWELGKIFGLGVSGYLGSVIEIEAEFFPAAQPGKGTIRFNDTAGSMAKDSVFNAAALVRRITGQDLAAYDIHVNVIGGGQIDGPSAGIAILTVIVSVLTGRMIRQDVAVTGEVSIRGRVKAVGGVYEKAYGAKQAGATTMIIPKENSKDLPPDHLDLNIMPVEKVEEALEFLLAKPQKGDA